MKMVISAAIIGAMFTTAAGAEDAALVKPIQAGSLHEGPLDMVAYYVPLRNEAYEVTATFIGRMPGDQPMRVVMKMDEGDDVSFAMPGYRSAQYRFQLSEGSVDISVDFNTDQVAVR